MGIKHLNKYLNSYAKNAITSIHFSELSNKKISVDMSIYLYRFIGENALHENMYSMLSTFKYYNIVPIFIFDGKPPIEKQEIIQERKMEKLKNKQKCEELEMQVALLPDNEKKDLQDTIDSLKKQCIFISKSDIDDSKKLIQSFGFSYYEAIGEADEVCVQLVLNNITYACLTEDMDMFVYGCNYVLRYLSLLNHNVIIYDYHKILAILNITEKEFREICILSGTDYNKQEMSIYTVFKWFHKYKNQQQTNVTFYDYINDRFNIDKNKLNIINDKFNLSKQNSAFIHDIHINNDKINRHMISDLLKPHGFLFNK
jgi:flap endonuclease-1